MTGGGSYAFSSQVEVTAVPNYGYHFTAWNDGDTTNPRIVTLTSDTALQALFAVNIYHVSVESNDKARGNVTGGGSYPYLSEVKLTATPSSNYHFGQWNDGDTANPRQITVVGDSSFVALFVKDSCRLSVVSNDTAKGRVSGTGSGYYSSLYQAKLVATPNYGYHFAQWDDGDTTNPRVVTLWNDTSFTAIFVPNIYHISVVSNNTAWGSVYGGGSYAYLTQVKISASPNTGYHFAAWSDGETANPRVVTLKGDTAVTALFMPNGYMFGAYCQTGQYLVYDSTSVMTVAVSCFDNTPISKVIIPDSVTFLGKTWYVTSIRSFKDCAADTVVMQDKMVTIGRNAFEGSGLKVLTIGRNVKKMDVSSFQDCFSLHTVYYNADSLEEGYFAELGLLPDSSNIKNIYIGGNVKFIPWDIFRKSKVDTLVIPDNVVEIGGGAFYGCANLKVLTIGNGVKYIGRDAFENCGLVELTLGRGLEAIADDAFENCTHLQIVWFNADSCRATSSYAFYGDSSIRYVYIGKDVKYIPGGIFGGTAVDALVVPDNVVTIGNSAFSRCANLKKLTLGRGLKEIGQGAFSYCSGLDTVYIPENVASIGGNAFGGCSSLNTVWFNADSCSSGWIYDDNTYTYKTAFYGDTALRNVHICGNVKVIPDYIFAVTGVESILIPDSVRSVGAASFYGCGKLKKLTFGKKVERIGNFAFCYTGFDTVVIPDNVEYIGESAFGRCDSLEVLTIGKGVKEIIGNDRIYLYGERVYSYGAFGNCPKLHTVYYNADSCGDFGDNYNNYSPWVNDSALANVYIGSNVKHIPAYIFKNIKGIDTLLVPDNVVTIRREAFSGCSNIRQLTFGKGLKEIGQEAFSGCSGLDTVIIPDQVDTIGSSAFINCTGLKEVTIGNGVRRIGGTAFGNCPSLQTVNFNADSCMDAYVIFGSWSNGYIYAADSALNSRPSKSLNNLKLCKKS